MKKGILLDENFGFVLKNKAMTVGDVTAQNQKILLLANKTEFKFNPMRGVGSAMFLEGSDISDYTREIRTEFIADGMKVNKIKVTAEGELEIDAQYE